VIKEKEDILDESPDQLMQGKRAVFAVKVLRDGRITIPEDQRKKLKIETGDWVKIVMEKLEE
jgi:hypothetical protein